jgi:hypothetical protein
MWGSSRADIQEQGRTHSQTKRSPPSFQASYRRRRHRAPSSGGNPPRSGWRSGTVRFFSIPRHFGDVREWAGTLFGTDRTLHLPGQSNLVEVVCRTRWGQSSRQQRAHASCTRGLHATGRENAHILVSESVVSRASMEQAASTQHTMLSIKHNSPSEAAQGRPQQSTHFARQHGPRGRARGSSPFSKQKESTANMQHGGASGNAVPIDGDVMQ